MIVLKQVKRNEANMWSEMEVLKGLDEYCELLYTPSIIHSQLLLVHFAVDKFNVEDSSFRLLSKWGDTYTCGLDTQVMKVKEKELGLLRLQVQVYIPTDIVHRPCIT